MSHPSEMRIKQSSLTHKYPNDKILLYNLNRKKIKEKKQIPKKNFDIFQKWTFFYVVLKATHHF